MEIEIFKQNYYQFDGQGNCLGCFWTVNFSNIPENQIMDYIEAGWCKSIPINACNRKDESQPILCVFASTDDLDEINWFEPGRPPFWEWHHGS
ncbi:hypothetical protein [Moorena sp. SIO2C4]|uniref:hypothetical protein n=1 Tax=Moorena sp. SIO2C4 TaxID=2607824 RepID=UPI0013C5A694|nr:hypothetical protein [Moorena sp. SIO2C4]NES42285.1 hypothetical protein [Moorena sp. SIO2C4]